jgi:hypothetical protein
MKEQGWTPEKRTELRNQYLQHSSKDPTVSVDLKADTRILLRGTEAFTSPAAHLTCPTASCLT